MVIVVVKFCVQVEPSGELYPVNVVPLLTSLSQLGTPWLLPTTVLVAVPPELVR